MIVVHNDLPEAKEKGGDADEDDTEVEKHNELEANMVTMMIKVIMMTITIIMKIKRSEREI